MGRLSRSALAKSVTWVVAIVMVMGGAAAPVPARAGDVWTNNGDCWRAGTPLICRMGWSANTTFTVQWTNYMPSGETTLLNTAITAMNSWNNQPGPQATSKRVVYENHRAIL